MLEVVEHLYVDLVIWAILFEQLAETVGKIILLSKFKDGLVDLLTKPYNCFAYKFRCPFARTYESWGHVSCKQGCGIVINIEGDVAVALKK